MLSVLQQHYNSFQLGNDFIKLINFFNSIILNFEGLEDESRTNTFKHHITSFRMLG